MEHQIDVAVLGATGAVGQRFIQLLEGHPWFRITELAASDRSAGQRYGDAARWVLPGGPPADIADQTVLPLDDETLIPPDSVLREFIGGSCYEY